MSTRCHLDLLHFKQHLEGSADALPRMFYCCTRFIQRRKNNNLQATKRSQPRAPCFMMSLATQMPKGTHHCGLVAYLKVYYSHFSLSRMEIGQYKINDADATKTIASFHWNIHYLCQATLKDGSQQKHLPKCVSLSHWDSAWVISVECRMSSFNLFMNK